MFWSAVILDSVSDQIGHLFGGWLFEKYAGCYRNSRKRVKHNRKLEDEQAEAPGAA
jgi:hypothetical protein